MPASPAPSSWQELGQLRVIDPSLRTVVGRDEIAVALAAARAAISRPPDVDRARLVSWGHVTEGELRKLVGASAFDDEEYAHLFGHGAGASVALFYAQTSHGE
jgi:hypothetical protein